MAVDDALNMVMSYNDSKKRDEALSDFDAAFKEDTRKEEIALLQEYEKNKKELETQHASLLRKHARSKEILSADYEAKRLKLELKQAELYVEYKKITVDTPPEKSDGLA